MAEARRGQCPVCGEFVDLDAGAMSDHLRYFSGRRQQCAGVGQPPKWMAEHAYISTACWHAQREPDPQRAGQLHHECDIDATRWDGTRKIAATCKWCLAPCRCPHHAGRDTP